MMPWRRVLQRGESGETGSTSVALLAVKGMQRLRLVAVRPYLGIEVLDESER